jgi:hypothetical protein
MTHDQVTRGRSCSDAFDQIFKKRVVYLEVCDIATTVRKDFDLAQRRVRSVASLLVS